MHRKLAKLSAAHRQTQLELASERAKMRMLGEPRRQSQREIRWPIGTTPGGQRRQRDIRRPGARIPERGRSEQGAYTGVVDPNGHVLCNSEKCSIYIQGAYR